MRRRIFVTLALVAVIGLSLAWVAGSYLSRPENHPIAPPAPPGRVVHLSAGDGVSIEGSYWPGIRPDGPAVLLLHGVRSSRASFDRQARWLNGLGYAVLAIDFRGHGGSAAVPRTVGLFEARDAWAALSFLRKDRPSRRVAVIGTSLGGAAALLGDRGPLPVQAMVLQAVYPDLRSAISHRIGARLGRPAGWIAEPFLSYQSWLRYGVGPARFSPLSAIRHFRGPVMIIGGAEDRYTPVSETRRLYAAASAPKAIWLLPGTDHAAVGSVFTEEYRRRIRAFLARTVGEPRHLPLPESRSAPRRPDRHQP